MDYGVETFTLPQTTRARPRGSLAPSFGMIARMPTPQQNPIAEARTLPALFAARVAETPDTVAYLHYDGSGWASLSWREISRRAARFQAALRAEDLLPGARVGIMAKNGPDWVAFDVAAMGLGLVTVPFYTDDRAENIAWISADAEVKLIVVEGRSHFRRLTAVEGGLPTVQRIACLAGCFGCSVARDHDPRAVAGGDWIPEEGVVFDPGDTAPDALATLVYTSGTTGRPKGVMLTHENILANARACARCAPIGPEDGFLSFLPLSHMLERTAGLYLPMLTGSRVAFARSATQLAGDLVSARPTALISVPRIYERVHARLVQQLETQPALKRFLFERTIAVGWRRFEHEQGRAGWHPGLLAWPLLDHLVARKVRERLGGRLKFAICGGAALAPEIARVFIGLGIPVYHGYGLTEASPVVSVNRPGDNLPASVGMPLPDVEVRLSPEGEVLVRGPSVMRGYWRNDEATAAALDADGWLHTGDLGRLDEAGHLTITGRIKEIIVLSNGEKVPPADIEMAVALDPCIEQVMVAGEGRPALVALLVLSDYGRGYLAAELGMDLSDDALLADRRVEKALLARIRERLSGFPGHARIRRALVLATPWSIGEGLLTPTLKLRREAILSRHAEDVDALYRGVES